MIFHADVPRLGTMNAMRSAQRCSRRGKRSDMIMSAIRLAMYVRTVIDDSDTSDSLSYSGFARVGLTV